MKKELQELISSFLKVKVKVVEREMTKERFDKKLFVESIILLREIEDRRDFMEDEIGVDMSIYEEKFMTIIENLFNMHFNRAQIGLIQYYLYEIPVIEDFSGKLSIEIGDNTYVVAFESPEDLWQAIGILEK